LLEGQNQLRKEKGGRARIMKLIKRIELKLQLGKQNKKRKKKKKKKKQIQ